MVGYEENFGVYRIYLPKEKKMIRSRDVRFDKDSVPLSDNLNADVNPKAIYLDPIQPVFANGNPVDCPEHNTEE